MGDECHRVAVPFEPVRPLAGPDGCAGVLRREASTELDHRAADRPAEGWTDSAANLALSGLLGQPCSLGLAGVSDPLMGHATPQLSAGKHLDLLSDYSSLSSDSSSSTSSSRDRPV